MEKGRKKKRLAGTEAEENGVRVSGGEEAAPLPLLSFRFTQQTWGGGLSSEKGNDSKTKGAGGASGFWLEFLEAFYLGYPLGRAQRRGSREAAVQGNSFREHSPEELSVPFQDVDSSSPR